MKQIEIDNILVNYETDKTGRIYNLTTKKELMVRKEGTVQLTINGKSKTLSVGRIIAKMFIPNPNPEEYIYVGHKDGDKTNNNIENLYWMTAKENSNNTWEKRRKNNTTGAGKQITRKQENIVGKALKQLEENEKQIELDGELIPYAIRKDGRVRNLKNGYVLKGTVLHSYHYINFRWEGNQKNKAVHQLVATAFIENPNNYTMVDHINGDRLNNSVENLRWVSPKENANNIHKNMTPKKPEYEISFSERRASKRDLKILSRISSF